MQAESNNLFLSARLENLLAEFFLASMKLWVVHTAIPRESRTISLLSLVFKKVQSVSLFLGADKSPPVIYYNFKCQLISHFSPSPAWRSEGEWGSWSASFGILTHSLFPAAAVLGLLSLLGQRGDLVLVSSGRGRFQGCFLMGSQDSVHPGDLSPEVPL